MGTSKTRVATDYAPEREPLALYRPLQKDGETGSAQARQAKDGPVHRHHAQNLSAKGNTSEIEDGTIDGMRKPDAYASQQLSEFEACLEKTVSQISRVP